MPAKTEKQRKFMAACTHGAKMKGKCPPKSVAKDFSRKPKGGYKRAAGRKR